MSRKPFITLKHDARHREEVKGSIFLAYGSRADTPEQAAAFLQTLQARHPDATHLCWAYRIGDQYRFSDGGEPGGTAGQPILRAIEGQGLDHVVVGVIRYFGGTKLGAGGLVRAYGGTAAEALRTAERHEEKPRIEILVEAPFEHLGALHRLLSSFAVDHRGEEYTESGIRIRGSLPAHELDRFRSELRDATRGHARLTEI
ncbi:MAG TPA: YigZ family protein [Methylococcus sp.]|nr:YigZ family protein [Methylococcus sp.]